MGAATLGYPRTMDASRAAALGIFAALWAWAPPVHADRIPGPPAGCPAGSWGHTEHAGQWCVPVECESDDQCAERVSTRFYPPEGARYRCEETALCVIEETYREGGNVLNPPEVTRRVARASCASDPCLGGTTCQRARRCVLDQTPPATSGGSEESVIARVSPGEEEAARTGSSSSSGCSAGPVRAGGGWALGVLGLLMWRSRRASTRGGER